MGMTLIYIGDSNYPLVYGKAYIRLNTYWKLIFIEETGSVYSYDSSEFITPEEFRQTQIDKIL